MLFFYIWNIECIKNGQRLCFKAKLTETSQLSYLAADRGNASLLFMLCLHTQYAKTADFLISLVLLMHWHSVTL